MVRRNEVAIRRLCSPSSCIVASLLTRLLLVTIAETFEQRSTITRGRSMRFLLLLILIIHTLFHCDTAARANEHEWQYSAEGIAIPAASADEPFVKEFGSESIRAAAKYLDDGATAWIDSNGCVACHTTGIYMTSRPSLSQWLGKPKSIVFENFVQDTPNTIRQPPATESRTKYEDAPITAVWRSLGLAHWDRHITGKVSEATDRSLRDMLLLTHHETGIWPTYRDLEIPYITTDFELSVHGAEAIAIAPNWLTDLKETDLLDRVQRLKTALGHHQPRNDFERTLQLQVISFWPDVISEQQKNEAIDMLLSKQHQDGSWSLRQMSSSDNWRDEVPESVQKLALEDIENGDPYMTAQAIILLRGVGFSVDDSRIQKAIGWLKNQQRESGRWWMRTMLRPTYHYITYIATAKAMSALASCGELDGITKDETQN
jgi:squalene-hopene/tetraprenyl-beta-curcumene cyclase